MPGCSSRRRPTSRGSSRIGLAWQSALAEARRSIAGDIRREGALLEPRAALPRPAPTPGSYNCRLIKLGKATAKAAGVREVQALLLLRRGRGRPADHRQADRQPAPGRPAVGGRQARPPDLPRQPGARRRAAAARLWRRPQARHGRRVRADRAVPLAAGHPLAAEHVQARRVRADPGRRPAANERAQGGSPTRRKSARIWSPPRRRASRSPIRSCSTSSATTSRGPRCARCARCWARSTRTARARRARAGGAGRAPVGRAARPGLVGRRRRIEPRLRRAVGRARGEAADRQLQRQAFDYWRTQKLSARRMAEPRTFTVTEDDDGIRLDRWFKRHCPTSASTSSRAGRGPASCGSTASARRPATGSRPARRSACRRPKPRRRATAPAAAQASSR